MLTGRLLFPGSTPAETNSSRALQAAAAERLTGYVSTMAAALAARERHDFARARQLLTAAPEEHRGFEWRLLDHLCAGDQRSLFRLPGGALPDALSAGPDGDSLAIVTHDGVLHLRRADGSALRPPRRLPVLSGGPDPCEAESARIPQPDLCARRPALCVSLPEYGARFRCGNAGGRDGTLPAMSTAATARSCTPSPSARWKSGPAPADLSPRA